MPNKQMKSKLAPENHARLDLDTNIDVGNLFTAAEPKTTQEANDLTNSSNLAKNVICTPIIDPDSELGINPSNLFIVAKPRSTMPENDLTTLSNLTKIEFSTPNITPNYELKVNASIEKPGSIFVPINNTMTFMHDPYSFNWFKYIPNSEMLKPTTTMNLLVNQTNKKLNYEIGDIVNEYMPIKLKHTMI